MGGVEWSNSAAGMDARAGGHAVERRDQARHLTDLKEGQEAEEVRERGNALNY